MKRRRNLPAAVPFGWVRTTKPRRFRKGVKMFDKKKTMNERGDHEETT